MIKQLKTSAILLLFLGALLSIPIVTKTLATHGTLAAFITGLAVIVLVVLGPLSFVVCEALDTDFAVALAITTNLEKVLVASLGLALLICWLKPLAREGNVSFPYISVTGWGLVGAYFCVLQVFTHVT